MSNLLRQQKDRKLFNDKEKKLLLDLFHLYGPSVREEPVLDFIKSYLEDNKINYKQDENGNIYCLNYLNEPLLSAHTDCVGTEEAGHYVSFIDLYPYGKDEILKGIGNIGADDKCGVFLILLMLKSRQINAVFSVCEEIGGAEGINFLTSHIRDNEVFKSIPYCLVLDRKNKGDIICSENCYGTKEFENELVKIGKEFGYKPTKGSISDMNTIRKYMNGCNLSVGYYNPHSNTEFASLNELYNCWKYINKIIDELPRNIKADGYSETQVSKYYPYYSSKKYDTSSSWDW